MPFGPSPTGMAPTTPRDAGADRGMDIRSRSRLMTPSDVGVHFCRCGLVIFGVTARSGRRAIGVGRRRMEQAPYRQQRDKPYRDP